MPVPPIRITQVRIHRLDGPLTERFGWSLNWTSRRTATLVEVRTDAGLTSTAGGVINAGPLRGTAFGPGGAIQSFVDRTSPILVTSLDLLPYLQEQAPFRWEPSRQPASPTRPRSV